MISYIIIVIIVTSAATYSSRFLGVLTSEKINEDSKIYRWFNCLAYSTLAALISRMIFCYINPIKNMVSLMWENIGFLISLLHL